MAEDGGLPAGHRSPQGQQEERRGAQGVFGSSMQRESLDAGSAGRLTLAVHGRSISEKMSSLLSSSTPFLSSCPCCRHPLTDTGGQESKRVGTCTAAPMHPEPDPDR